MLISPFVSPGGGGYFRNLPCNLFVHGQWPIRLFLSGEDDRAREIKSKPKAHHQPL
jgi:hypothetical protein